jgi:hypothetical protein
VFTVEINKKHRNGSKRTNSLLTIILMDLLLGDGSLELGL